MYIYLPITEVWKAGALEKTACDLFGNRPMGTWVWSLGLSPRPPMGSPPPTKGLLRQTFWEICWKTQNNDFILVGSVIFPDIFRKKRCPELVLISYVHPWTSIYVYLCPEMAKMIAQICKSSRKSKGIPIHNGTYKGGPAAGRYCFTCPLVLAYLGYHLGHK